MSRVLRAILVAFTGVLLWFVARFWVASASERFYLVLPIVCLGGYTLLANEPWRRIRRYIPIAAAGFVALFLLASVYCQSIMNPISGAELGFLHPAVLRESFFASYFLVAVALVFTGLGWYLSAVIRAVGTRYLERGNNKDTNGSVLLRCLEKVLPYLVLAVLAVPYLVGATYIHRVKVPNLRTPRQLDGRDYEDVEFVASDGGTLRGWYIPAREPSPRTVLLCHGLNANRANFLYFVQVADALKANVLMFDFRGHGESDGHTVSLGHYESHDILAAADWLRRHHAKEARVLIGMGISLGASSLILAAADIDKPFDAVILDSPFAAVTDLTDNVLEPFPPVVRPMLTLPGIPMASLEAGCRLADVRPIDVVSRMRCPALFIHSQNDLLIPCEHSRRLADRSGQPPENLWLVQCSGHASALADVRDEYLERIRHFCEACGVK
jgi:hypothetical protein